MIKCSHPASNTLDINGWCITNTYHTMHWQLYAWFVYQHNIVINKDVETKILAATMACLGWIGCWILPPQSACIYLRNKLVSTSLNPHNLARRKSKSWYMGFKCLVTHYNDVIMGTIASQITSLTIVHSTFYSDADQRNHQNSASNAENVSIWWRQHDGLRTDNGWAFIYHLLESCDH